MKSYKTIWNTVRFVKSAVLPSQYPKLYYSAGSSLPEVAVAGRSNVGKSSFINSLFTMKALAKTSATPGKTQLLNFFVIDDFFAFVDLPGYGYAKVSKEIKSTWAEHIEHYLEQRDTLTVCFLLLDIRREVSEDDILFFKWAKFHKKNPILILTKTDKVSANEKKINKERIVSALCDKTVECVYYSSKTHDGREQVRKLLIGMFS